ncbi:YwqJ-related putative deaminase [Streptomyces uncialis]|uniref:YwqJ-related putative deaminase n=1 Tax=Streptomyces uncialis TaxID=1048205 RepID=UPI001161121E|nr:YwqJ-related putative deaminase [Streptomyces uncialis]
MHARFQGLSAFYTAPEAERLFATTGPVKSESDVFADQLESVTTALSEYAAEVRPIEARLKQLKADATAFVSGISGDKHWKDDGDKVEENNDLVKDVNAAVAAFWEAERACANKITALVCGTHFIADDGTGKSNMYGFSEKDLDGTEELPWGSQVEESRRWWEVHHHVGSFLKGVFVDGLWGTIRGLGTLVGVDGWDAAGQAWTGLAKVVTGLAITVTPVLGTVFWTLPEEKLPGWFRESRTAVKETGKALVAWDEWGKNPARAAGATTFNVVTTVFTGGAGAAAKTGSVAKVISALGKTGRLLDPVTYIAKGGKVVTVKVGDLLAGLRNVDAGARINIPEPATPAPVAGADDAARAGTGPDPSHTVRLPDDANGSPQYLDTNTGQLLDAAGNPKPDVMPRDVTNPDRSGAEVPPVRSETPVQVGAREPALVGAGPVAGTIDNAAGGAPGGVTPGATTPGAGTPGGVTPGGGAVPGAVTPGGGAVPGGGGLDGLPGGGANNLPGGGAGQLPGGGAGQLPGGAVDNLPGGGANNMPSNSHIDSPANGRGSYAEPGTGAGSTPDVTHSGGSHSPGEGPPLPHQGSGPDQGGGGRDHQAPGSAATPEDALPPTVRVGEDGTPPPAGAGEKLLDQIDPTGPRATVVDGFITHVDGRPVAQFLEELSRSRSSEYLLAKENKTFPRAQTGACVGAVMDLRTGTVIEGINGPSSLRIPVEELHPALLDRFRRLEAHPLHESLDNPLGHAEVKAVNELLWMRTRQGLSADASVIREMRASVEFPFLKHKETGLRGRGAPFCWNCANMLEGLPSSHGRYNGYPPSDENWTP